MSDLANVWDLPAPWQIEPMSGSAHNHLALIVAADDQHAVLCTYSTDAPSSFGYTQAVLQALTTQKLPFALPLPMRTRSGTSLHRHDDGYRTWVMTMLPWFDGDHPTIEDVDAYFHAGRVHAQLLNALATVIVSESSPPPYMTLNRVHPYIIDPLAALRVAPLPNDQVKQLVQLVETLQSELPALYEALPRQIIHGDFEPSNVLVTDAMVSAVLDFELCRNDVRVLDVALAMLAWGGFGERYDEAALLRFGQGFAQIITLSDAEIIAIPTMMRLAHVVRVLLALGRFQQGFERSVVVERATMSLLNLDTWLHESSDTLLADVHRWWV
jgi:Ser/Thr protein kinase RdoA (MazF antagonist)